MVLTRRDCTSLTFLMPVRTLPGSMNKFLQHHRTQFALLNSPAICITWADRRLVSQQRRLKRQRHRPLQNWSQCDIRNWTTDGCKSCFHLEKTAIQTVSYKVGNIDHVVGKKELCVPLYFIFLPAEALFFSTLLWTDGPKTPSHKQTYDLRTSFFVFSFF